MLTLTLRELLDKAVELKKSSCDFYDRALKLEPLHPIPLAAFTEIAPQEKAHLARLEALRSLPLVSGAEGAKPVTIDFLLEPNRNRILPPDTVLNVAVRSLELEKRCHEFYSRFAAAVTAEPVKKELSAVEAGDLDHRRLLDRRFDEWDAQTYGSQAKQQT